MAGARRCARTANTPAPSASVASPSRPSFAMPNPQDDRLGPHIASFAMAFHQGLQALASARMPGSVGVLLRQTNKRQTRSSAIARPPFVHLAKVRIMLKRRIASSSSNGGACDSPGAVGKFFAASV
jgi:hypothetical protein